MPKLFAICKETTRGEPQVDWLATPVAGRLHVDSSVGYGAYLFSGTAGQLAALNALPDVIGVCGVTDGGDIKWPELDGVVSATVRTKLNTWLSARGFPTIPAGWTYRQIVVAVYKRLNADYDILGNDLA